MSSGWIQIHSTSNRHVVEDVVLKAILKGYQKGAARGLAVARKNCPVDTGKLKASIKAGARIWKQKNGVSGWLRSGGKGVMHAALQEYGTVKMKPHPFMRPGRAAAMNDIKANMQGAL